MRSAKYVEDISGCLKDKFNGPEKIVWKKLQAFTEASRQNSA